MEVTAYASEKIHINEFSLDDFVQLLFPHGQKMMQDCARIILLELKRGPKTISDIVIKHKLKRGTAYDTADYLRRWGIIDREAKFEPVRISSKFPLALERLGFWFRKEFGKSK